MMDSREHDHRRNPFPATPIRGAGSVLHGNSASPVTPQGRMAASLRQLAVPLAILGLLHIWRAHAIVADAAVYAQTIEDGRFFERSIHVLYYACGWLAHVVLGRFGMATDEALVLFNAVLITSAVLLARTLYLRLGIDRRLADVAVLTLLFSGNVIVAGTGAEIHALQLVCILGSCLLFHSRRVTASAVVFAAAVLVSPLSVFAAGFHVWLAWRERRPGDLARVAVIGCALVGAVLIWCWRDYFFGIRGLLSVGLERKIGLGTAVYNVAALFKNFHWLIPFAPIGLWALRRSGMASLVTIVLLMHAPLFFSMREDGVFMIVAYPFLALAMAAGLFEVAGRLRRNGRVLPGAVVAAYVLTGAYTWLDPPSERFRSSIDEFLRDCPGDATVIASWGHAAALEFYAGLSGTELPAIHRTESMTDDDLRRRIGAGGDVFLVEKYYPSRVPRSLFPPGELHRRHEANALLARARRAVPGVRHTTMIHQPGGLTVYRLAPPTSGPGGEGVGSGVPMAQ